MDKTAIKIVREYIEAHLDKSDSKPQFEVYTVWKAKALQNWKYLLSSTLCDGMYYEATYNGDKNEWYLDAYKKFENKTIPGTQDELNLSKFPTGSKRELKGMTTGERIKKIRTEKGLTLRKLSELSGIRDTTLRKYENGERNPKLETLIVIADALDGLAISLIGDDDKNGKAQIYKTFYEKTLKEAEQNCTEQVQTNADQRIQSVESVERKESK